MMFSQVSSVGCTLANLSVTSLKSWFCAYMKKEIRGWFIKRMVLTLLRSLLYLYNLSKFVLGMDTVKMGLFKAIYWQPHMLSERNGSPRRIRTAVFGSKGRNEWSSLF